MISTIITAAIGLLCTLVSSIITFLLTKRKYDEEVDAAHLKDLNDAFQRYKTFTDEMYKAQDEKIKALQKENTDLKQQINYLQKQMVDLLSMTCIDVKCNLRKEGLVNNKK